ncbi:hypothetical protein SLEP1_g44286 [Rubroshorea leprosula]|uniref:Uncharacterized protein n=1 Tax=Rubroshorea leprosula TaxID=152421 RepID=A0AAV5LFT2_9ROSI|nr:hypothetical protein SLEP1_g44286 [Rubroshorea leprosula]
MAGAFSWKSVREYVYSYYPLDSGADSAGAGFASSSFASSGLAFTALLSGYSTAKYGYLGYLVLWIQQQGMSGLRTSVIFANLQKGLGALFGLFLVYMAKFRMGLARTTLYTYASFISVSSFF